MREPFRGPKASGERPDETGSSSAGREKRVVVVGAGPAGLTAAYQLAKAGVPALVLEKDAVVGGISRTVHYNGYLFDIGGHRFFTKVRRVEEFWNEVLPPEDFVERKRRSRIYYRKTFFDYPLRPVNALLGLGPWTSLLVALSYLKARLFPIREERSFADWASNRFGRRLFSTFFDTYTEKVWGIPCSRLSADWAAQRIRALSLSTAIKSALVRPKPATGGDKRSVIKTLIESFHYPRRGPGMMWEAVAERVRERGSEVRLSTGVERIHHRDGRVVSVEVERNGAVECLEGSDFISTMPVRELVQKLDPPPPADVLSAASKLSYRDFLTVALIVNNPEVFPDTWLYIHDPDVKVGRIQNFKAWSPDMVAHPEKSCVGLEYFCFEGDGLWTASDEDLIALAKREMAQLGLVRADEVEDAAVVRMPKAYPVYDHGYAVALLAVRQYLAGLSNLHLVGRNGMHKYNNQDHSILTAMLAVENILGASHDVWAVNVDPDYHEDGRAAVEPRTEFEALAASQPRVPLPIGEP